jgi:DSF synthase
MGFCMSSSVLFDPALHPFEAPFSLPPFAPIDLTKKAYASEPERPLFGLRQLDVEWDATCGTMWTHIRFEGRPCYNPEILADFRACYDGVEQMFKGRERDLRYFVHGSRFPGVFSLGGDLGRFARWIRSRDRQGLVQYGKACVRLVHRTFIGLNLPIVTIALVQGDALGGGFETVLSFNVVVAEKGVKFGFPENLFGLFPGMGAYSLLSRRIGAAKAESIILSGTTYTAEEMHDLGVVQILAEPGQGTEAVRRYIERHGRRHGGYQAIYRAAREVNPVFLDELDRIVEIWADAALQLSDKDLRLMERLAAAQDRLLGIPTLVAAE